MLDHVGEVLDAIVDADGEELCYHYRVCVFCVFSYCDRRGGRSRRARGRQRSHRHSVLPQRFAAQRICRILRARRYGSQRKLFPSFRGAAVRYAQRFYFPPLYVNRAWWRLEVPLTGLEYERHSMPSMTLPRFIISNGESDQMISHDEVARGAR